MTNRSLAIVGSGIKAIAHLTREATSFIESSEVVFYLVNHPAISGWLAKLQVKAVCLDELYFATPNRHTNYVEIAKYILAESAGYANSSLIIYGHPTMFAQPVSELVSRAGAENINITICPGISAEDALFADLGIDPAPCGWQNYDATGFLEHKNIVNTYAHLILWQVGVIGTQSPVLPSYKGNSRGLTELKDLLIEIYSEEHPVIIYEAAIDYSNNPLIKHLPLKELGDTELSPISTLYVYPISLNQYS